VAVTLCDRLGCCGAGVRSNDEREDEEVSVLADHRADPGDDVPATPSAPADGDSATPGDAAAPEPTGVDADGAGAAIPALRPDQLRADFGAHFEANYQRLVAQLYAITLNPAEAHDVVREAYSRAWRRWAEVGSSADPTAWVRRVAVRSTMRSWRRTVARLAPGRRRGTLVDGGEPRTRAALTALGRLPDTARRAVVLVDMAGVPVVEVAALEQVPPGTVAARLSRGRRVVGDALADVAPATPVSIGPYGHGGRW
jgi:DNA-directed RNA polymerase specialized sigma24 family protein